MDSESTSRSSVKDLSVWTSSVGILAISLTISARPSTISCFSAAIFGAPSSFVLLRIGAQRPTSDGAAVERWLGKGDDRRRVGETGPVADDERGVPALRLPRRQQPLHGERDGGCRGVA